MNDNMPDTRCPKCRRDCIFKWQEFVNGTRHIQQKCPVHGYLKYAPKVEPYISLANAYTEKNNIIQKRLFE